MKLIELIKYVEKNPFSALFYTPNLYKDGKTYLFKKFEKSINITGTEQLPDVLASVDKEISSNKIVVGLIDYEFGYLLEERLNSYVQESAKSLAQFLITDQNYLIKINSSELDYTGLDKFIGDDLINHFELNTDKKEYIKNVNYIRQKIKEGDTYQVNYTIKSNFKLIGTVTQLFCQLIFSQSAEYSALINLGDEFIISSSPELFFDIHSDEIKVKPMKGTISRGYNIEQDQNKMQELTSSQKDRAENVMIVDLLRNDIGKLCHFDSVKVTNQYNIEKFESIFQLTSEIKGILREKRISEIIKNLFPSGSITGAPKLRTMEIINEIEKETRGIYTGLIGIFAREFSIANVAIRTIAVNKKTKNCSLGIGSGIVWGSDPENEFEEVLLKAKFLQDPLKYFEIFESMLIDKNEVFLLEYHIKRLAQTAHYFLFLFNEKKIRLSIKQQIEKLNETKKYKMRLSLTKWGDISFTISELENNMKNISVIISSNKINSHDRFQYFKTTNRKKYDEEINKYKTKGYDEVIYFNENGKLAEGAITNILVQIEDKLYTPSVSSGLLNGCYRQFILGTNPAVIEKDISFEELINSEKVILINSVRKEMIISNLYDKKGKLIKKFN